MTLIPSETITYLSFGAPCSVIKNVDTPDVVHIPKFLNRIVASNLLNHKLKLKIEISIMLSRNIDQSFAYCNDTWLTITQLGNHIFKAKVIYGSKIGENVLISILSLISSDPRISFKFQRKKELVVVSFAMTINKSQI